MKKQNDKLPQKGGGRKASDIFEKTRKKEPSDNLVKIISQIPENNSDKKPNYDRAAKDLEI
jgi:hypothetical protein